MESVPPLQISHSRDQHGDLISIERLIGYQFSNRGLLRTALYHVSANKTDNNSQLAWLGSAIWGLLTATTTYSDKPTATAQDMHRSCERQGKAVCAAAAESLGLPKWLQHRLGDHTVSSKIKADLLQAILAAVFVDSGYSLATAARVYHTSMGQPDTQASLYSGTSVPLIDSGQGFLPPPLPSHANATEPRSAPQAAHAIPYQRNSESQQRMHASLPPPAQASSSVSASQPGAGFDKGTRGVTNMVSHPQPSSEEIAQLPPSAYAAATDRAHVRNETLAVTSGDNASELPLRECPAVLGGPSVCPVGGTAEQQSTAFLQGLGATIIPQGVPDEVASLREVKAPLKRKTDQRDGEGVWK